MENSQLFLQHWEKENNPIYPQEMHWDRIKINQMLSAYEAQKPMRWIAFDFNKIETRPPNMVNTLCIVKTVNFTGKHGTEAAGHTIIM
jgi:hypothetical protein